MTPPLAVFGNRSKTLDLLQLSIYSTQPSLMILSLRSLLAAGVVLVPLIAAQADPQLTGTWTTKSRKVVTGPVRPIKFLSLTNPSTWGSHGRYAGVSTDW